MNPAASVHALTVASRGGEEWRCGWDWCATEGGLGFRMPFLLPGSATCVSLDLSESSRPCLSTPRMRQQFKG